VAPSRKRKTKSTANHHQPKQNNRRPCSVIKPLLRSLIEKRAAADHVALRTLLLRLLPRVVTSLLPTVLPRRCQPYCEAGANHAANRKNLLLGWRYWLVGAASEPLRLRVAGGRRWPAYWALWLPRRAAWRCSRIAALLSGLR
jgi:hypothetical protein